MSNIFGDPKLSPSWDPSTHHNFDIISAARRYLAKAPADPGGRFTTAKDSSGFLCFSAWNSAKPAPTLEDLLNCYIEIVEQAAIEEAAENAPRAKQISEFQFTEDKTSSGRVKIDDSRIDDVKTEGYYVHADMVITEVLSSVGAEDPATGYLQIFVDGETVLTQEFNDQVAVASTGLEIEVSAGRRVSCKVVKWEKNFEHLICRVRYEEAGS